jgi:replication-associated recombination protein RarA
VANLAEIMRPEKLEEVIGNTSTIQALQKQLNDGNLSQTLMFVGGYGRGKTTLAKIIARVVMVILTTFEKLLNLQVTLLFFLLKKYLFLMRFTS